MGSVGVGEDCEDQGGHASSTEADCTEHECEEYRVVPEADAFAEERAVVIVSLDAAFTETTMMACLSF